MILKDTHLELLEPLPGDVTSADGLEADNLVTQAEVTLLLEVGQHTGTKEQLKQRFIRALK